MDNRLRERNKERIKINSSLKVSNSTLLPYSTPPSPPPRLSHPEPEPMQIVRTRLIPEKPRVKNNLCIYCGVCPFPCLMPVVAKREGLPLLVSPSLCWVSHG
ncbi:hypothetical protein CHARACLAT_017508 [Characodon lateralis]|uniref:4Fe-4S ferredoxin-type domain-containing protein n=1 Tax=Characodon lateralis TaxID=208331 RepID=A0ABU7D1X0_9TELE|nr:hypothetical protein [Characodon lateralis]